MPYKAEERSAGAEIKSLLDDLVDEYPLIKNVVVEPRDSQGKKPDLVIFDSNDKPICAIEIKLPTQSPYHASIYEQAFGYANNEGIEYFATFNLKKLVIWKTFEEDTTLLQRRYKEYEISSASSPTDYQRDFYREAAKRNFQEVLDDLVHLQVEKPEDILPSLSPDQIFINFLQSTIESISKPIAEKIIKKITHSPSFRKKIQDWYIEQGWQWTNPEDISKRMARQYALILTNKIIFYDVLRGEYQDLFSEEEKSLKNLPDDLPPLSMPESIEDGGILQSHLQGYFKKVLKVDYKTIYSDDIFQDIELPEEAVPVVKNLANQFQKYDFSDLDYEIIGNIFERMIPREDRHKFGQYFTRSDVVDLIIASCVESKEDAILDPACGAGTFLIRGYSRLKYLGFKGDHKEILEKLWGGDIAKFPAHLSTINLVTRDLSERENFPRIASNQDFFDLGPHSPLLNSSFTTEGLNHDEMERELPTFDALVTNPPYTRQEEIEDKTEEGYKERIRNLIQKETDTVLSYISKRHSIYSYFFLHGAQFIKDKGKMGLITSNSWLDTDFGKDLQKYFLKKFKIKAIIESSVERFFSDADINTVITILERCTEEEEREENPVKFVQLKEDLLKVLERFDEGDSSYKDWGDDKRWEVTDSFLMWLENQSETITEDYIRIHPRLQKELWDEGFNQEKNKYTGSKWGKYLRGPDVFFKILEENEEILAPLNDIGEVTRGFTTGANSFFYLDDEEIEKHEIEEGYLEPIVKSPKEINGLKVNYDSLKYKALIVEKDEDLESTNAQDYIELGEEEGYHQRPTCAGRDPWYTLPSLPEPDILFNQFFYQSFTFPIISEDILVDHTFYYLCLEDVDPDVVAALLNSSIGILFTELFGRTVMGEGALVCYGPEIKPLLIPDPSALSEDTKRKLKEKISPLTNRSIGTIFDEFGSDEPSTFKIDDVKEDRRELDKVVMENILDLSENDQKEVYVGVLNLVKTRREKAESVEKSKKKKEKFSNSIDQLTKLVLYSLKESKIEGVKNFDMAEEGGTFELSEEVKMVKKGDVPKAKMDVEGDSFVEMGEKTIDVLSSDIGKYLKFNLLLGKEDVTIPKEKDELNEALEVFKEADLEIKNVIKNTLDLIDAKSKEDEKEIENEIYINVWRNLQ